MSATERGKVVDAPADQRILEIAFDHLRRFGPKRVTIVGIADEAGMSHANIYRYYPSKRALIEAVTAAWLKTLEGDLRLIVEGPDPAYDKLERAILSIQHAYLDRLESDPVLFRLLCDAVEKNQVVARKHRNKAQSEIQKIVEDGMAAGSFRPIDRRRAMSLIFDLAHRFIHPLAIWLDRDAARVDLERRAARAVAIILRALSRAPDLDI